MWTCVCHFSGRPNTVNTVHFSSSRCFLASLFDACLQLFELAVFDYIGNYLSMTGLKWRDSLIVWVWKLLLSSTKTNNSHDIRESPCSGIRGLPEASGFVGMKNCSQWLNDRLFTADSSRICRRNICWHGCFCPEDKFNVYMWCFNFPGYEKTGKEKQTLAALLHAFGTPRPIAASVEAVTSRLSSTEHSADSAHQLQAPEAHHFSGLYQ